MEERERERVGRLGVAHRLVVDERLGQPLARVDLAARAGRAQLVDREPRRHGREVGLRRLRPRRRPRGSAGTPPGRRPRPRRPIRASGRRSRTGTGAAPRGSPSLRRRDTSSPRDTVTARRRASRLRVENRKETTMRVFVAGATGAIGTRLVPQLVERGHEVIGTSRSPEKADRLRALGAEPSCSTCSTRARCARPSPPRGRTRSSTRRPRSPGLTRLQALRPQLRARRTGCGPRGPTRCSRRPREAGVGALRRAELRRLAVRARGRSRSRRRTIRSTRRRCRRCARRSRRSGTSSSAVVAAGGLALRYGGFYGSPDDAQLELVRKRRFPIVGDGGGDLVVRPPRRRGGRDRARARARRARRLQRRRRRARAGRASGCPRWPRRSARSRRAASRAGSPGSLAGEAGVVLMTEMPRRLEREGEARARLDARYPSWREGFRAAYGANGSKARALTTRRDAGAG